MLTAKEIIEGLKPCHYRYNGVKALGEGIHFGFLAQEILEEFGSDYSFVKKDGGGEYYQVNYYQFIAPMVSVIKEQQSEIDSLRDEIMEIKDQL